MLLTLLIFTTGTISNGMNQQLVTPVTPFLSVVVVLPAASSVLAVVVSFCFSFLLLLLRIRFG